MNLALVRAKFLPHGISDYNDKEVVKELMAFA